jgi:monoamine oxidase
MQIAADNHALVLGAGVAGLTAARALARSGARVTVLEARDRVGGRLWTEQVTVADLGDPIPVELGAEFVHGLPPELWATLTEARLETYELEGSSVTVKDNRLSPADQSPGGDVIAQMMRWNAAQPAGTDLSFSQYLDIARPDLAAREAAMRYVEGFNAADSQRISVASLCAQQRAEDAAHSERLFRVRHGYSALPHFLAHEAQQAGATMQLGRVVSQVLWKPGHVAMSGTDVEGNAFSTSASSAVITLPLGVLQSALVRFSPEPTDTLSAAQGLVMGPVNRTTLVFRNAFWREIKSTQMDTQLRMALQDLSFLFASNERPGTWWTAMPDPAPVITGWVGGPKSLARCDSWVLQCLTSLSRILDLPIPYLQQQLVTWRHHDWQEDDFARGAYSYVAVGGLESSRRLSLPVEQTLFFAGEHTDLSFNWGTVHGALRSGLRAAHQVMNR